MKDRDQVLAVGEMEPGREEPLSGGGKPLPTSEGPVAIGIEPRFGSEEGGAISPDAMEEGGLMSPALHAGDDEIVAEYALTEGQKALWFLQRLNPEGGTNNLAYGARISHELDVTAWERAIYLLLERHPVLRTTFPEVNGEPLQRVHAHPPPGHFVFIDATQSTPDELQRKISEVIFQRLDLEKGPLHRGTLFKLAEDYYLYFPLMHHIISDMWSIALYSYELGNLYSALKTGKDPDLKPPRFTYEDHVREQMKVLAGESGENLWEFWREELAGELPVLGLIPDFPRPPVATYRGAAHSIRLGEELSAGLAALAREEGVDLMSLCLAVYQILLHRYTGQSDILVSTPKACRTRKTAKMLGYFINPVVIRGNLAGNPPFNEFLKKIAGVARQALDHGDFPYSLLVERLKIPRDPSRTPLCQAVFAWQKTTRLAGEGINMFALNTEGGRMDLGEVVVDSFRMEERVAPFEINLQMNEVDGCLGATMEYNTDLYRPETIHRMLGHLRGLFESVVADPRQKVGKLALLTEEERRQILVDWNRTEAALPAARLFPELFEEQVERVPEAAAAIFEDQSLTYLELNARANRLARYLRHRGVGLETKVGICLDRSLDLLVAMLGVMKAGGAYIPLDPHYPPDRLAFMFRDSEARVLVTRGRLAGQLPSSDVQVVRIDEEWERIEEESGENLSSLAGPENAAYLIYTSGSTGEPKGAILVHRGLSNLAAGWQSYLNLSEGDRVLQFAPFSFDASVADIVMALGHGATLVMARQERLASLDELHRLLKEERISVVTLPPTVLRLLETEGLDDLKLMISAGEPCTGEIVRRWRQGRRFFNAYGPTETTVCATVEECRDEGDNDPPIGRPIPNVEIYILDGQGEVAPIGAAGELFIGGAGLARGYWRRDELTGEKFISHPFRVEPGARLYRTGDMARYLADGRIEYLGRVDEQVKLRGYRIELGEIEALLRRHPGVKDGAVALREDTTGDKRLVGYIIAADTASEVDLSTPQLRAYLREFLPEYMVPASFVTLGTLPLLPNGKVDRKKLPAPSLSRPVSMVLPQTETERAIASIWKEVLGLEQVGLHENFFDLGGHSLLLSKAHSQLRAVIGRELSMVDLFRHPTISALAAFISQGEEAKPAFDHSHQRAARQRVAIERQQQMRRNRLGASGGDGSQ